MDAKSEDRSLEQSAEHAPRVVGSRSALAFALVGTCWVGAHALGLLGSQSDRTFPLLAMAAIGGTVLGMLRWRPTPLWPWVMFVTAFVLFLGGGYARTVLGTLGNLTAERSVVPDLITMPGYVILGIALIGLGQARLGGRFGDADAFLDAAIAALAVLTLAWQYLIEPALSQHEAPLTVRLFLAIYPPLSVYLVAVALRIVFAPGFGKPLAMKLVMGALGCMLIGDVLYMLVDAGIVAVPSQLVDVPYALAYVAFTTAVLHPSTRQVNEPVGIHSTQRKSRLLLVAVALCVPSLLILTRNQAGAGDRIALSLIMLALTAAAACRMLRALRAHAESEARLAYRASYDLLTALPNRDYIGRQLSLALCSPLRPRMTALVLLDLDRFGLVNESMGHSVGDDLLVSVAQRLQNNVRAGDLVGRVGGDEFVVTVSSVRDEEEAFDVAERLRLVFKTPFWVDEHEIAVSASAGVALRRATDPDTDVEAMFRDADTATHQAKAAGGDGVAVFDASMREDAVRRLLLERELRHALERDELRVVYQPIVRVHDGRVAALEALLRWTNPTFGEVRPDLFIPVAEDTGLIVEIGAWVLDQACGILSALRSELDHTDELSMAVNLSARQLQDDSFIDEVARSLIRHDLPASSLCLELTESLLMDNLDRTSKLLARLRATGIKIAVDDFGTGYSSLAYLKLLPVDEVKIDRSFVIDLLEDGSSERLVEAVVSIANALDISTVAEGVEERGQAVRLQELGCTEAQGYLYARPTEPGPLRDVLIELGLAGEPRLHTIAAE